MELEERASRFRGEVERLGLGKSGRPFPAAMRAEAVAILQARLGTGGTLTSVSRELGLPRSQTLTRWRTECSARGRRVARPRLERVEVVEAPPRRAAAPVVVQGPRGLRIEGLDLEQVAELLRRLS